MQTNALLSQPRKPDATAALSVRVAALVERHGARWRQTPCETPVLGAAVRPAERRDNGRAAAGLIEQVAAAVEAYPRAGRGRRAWRERLKVTIRTFGERRLGWPTGYRSLLVSDEFYEASIDFARRARAFDPEIKIEDIGQALRNVWIANSLQMLLDRPAKISPAIFAYSMLYPYTDNLLDDTVLDAVGKRRFNDRLSRRLRGEPVAAESSREGDVYRLIEMIEIAFPRPQYADVHASLLAIQQGQIHSLRQQARHEVLFANDVLAISVEKGGTSVLADGYLVAGDPAAGEVEFFFGYGVFLQLLDDLQDARADLEAGHRTLFSMAADRVPLDRLTSQLYNFMTRFLEDAPRFNGSEFEDRIDLIRRNCTYLLVDAVAENESLFSRPFRRQLEECWPFSLAAMRRLRRLAKRRFKKTSRRLRASGDADELAAFLG